MGNYISIIIGCVGAVELITFLHQFSLSADEEHDRELEQESRDRGQEITPRVVSVPVPDPVKEVARITQRDRVEVKEKEEPQQQLPARQPSPVILKIEDPPEDPQEEIVEENLTKIASKTLLAEPPLSLLSRSPEIRFELYERSCSLSDVDRPLVDGLKMQRPLMRDDGSGRRKPIKKRNSSGSIDWKASREEELRMFTSLEEEEFSSLSEGGFVPISYGANSNASDATSVKYAKRHRRFKRSPVKDTLQNLTSEESASSHEVLDDIPLLDDPLDPAVTYPWGDINPKCRKKHAMHEKSMSIEELQEDDEERITNDGVTASAIESNTHHSPLVATTEKDVVVESVGEVRREEVDESVSSRIIVSIESEPNIERFARLSLHEDEDCDADDDMTPMATSQEHRMAFQYQRLDEKIADGDDDDEETLCEEEQVAIVQEEVVLEEDTKSDSISDVRTISPDDSCEGKLTLEEDTEDMSFVNVEKEEVNEEIVYPGREMEEEEIMEAMQEYLIDSPICGQSIDISDPDKILVPVAEEESFDEDVALNREIELFQQNGPAKSTAPTLALNSFLELERNASQIREPENDYPEPTFLEIPSTVRPVSTPVITTEESSGLEAVIDEDISNYHDFVSIMQSSVLKEARSGIRFPIKFENKEGDFPKTMSELINFDDDEDMSAAETKKIKMRRREDSIKTKIVNENTTLYKSTGHHRRYNMPSHSVDIDTRLELSNRQMEEEKKVFPRRRQIFIPGNFPRNITTESDNKLHKESKAADSGVRMQRITYTQPIVQLTMIREEVQPKKAEEESLPATPQGLSPTGSIPVGVNRQRSVSPFIVDRDDPMMMLLKDSMAIPLVHDGNM